MRPEKEPQPRLRILHVVASYYPAVRYGGPIRSVHGLAAALARQGHDVHVYTTNVDGDSLLDVPVDRPVLLDGVKVHYYGRRSPSSMSCTSTPFIFCRCAQLRVPPRVPASHTLFRLAGCLFANSSVARAGG
jgi:glycosyltransferase involved in cell wall biosynthesis